MIKICDKVKIDIERYMENGTEGLSREDLEGTWIVNGKRDAASCWTVEGLNTGFYDAELEVIDEM